MPEPSRCRIDEHPLLIVDLDVHTVLRTEKSLFLQHRVRQNNIPAYSSLY